jgi:uncharacterized protein (TIGR02246 family)
MSEENVEIVRTAIRAFTERDADGFADCFASNAELLLPRNRLEGGSYKGRDGIKRAVADAFEMWTDVLVDVQSTRAVGDQVVVLSRVTNIGGEHAPAIEYESGYVAKLSGGKIVYLRPYESHRQALEAAGLSE